MTQHAIIRLWVPPLLSCAIATAHAETRGYVISSFTTATHSVNFEESCPENRNGGGAEWMVRDLISIGIPAPRARRIAEGVDDDDGEVRRRLNLRASVNGEPASIYNYPDAVPDPNIETVSGKYAYGFDLGGPVQNKFIDPETGGPVDNQLWRAIGCTASFRAIPPATPFPEDVSWNAMVETSPGWAITISGEDLTRDGPVTVVLDRLTKHPERDAEGNVMSKATYVLDGAGTSRNVLEGELKGGLITIQPKDIFLESEMPFYPEIALRNGHLRIQLQDDGTLLSYWGGYMNWKIFAYMITSRPGHGGDSLGIYHAVKKLADASPDATGQNQEISSAWRVTAVPAYIATPEGKIVAQAVQPQMTALATTAAAQGDAQ